MSGLVLLPAVDVSEGQAVQLVQGELHTKKVFGDPVKAALRWQKAGAKWIHLVDLDAAFGRGSNADVISRVIAETDLKVELSGGLRDDETLERALGTGCARVNISTAALENPEWCDRIVAEDPERIAVGLDVRGNRLAARGWTNEGGDVFEVLERLNEAGCQRYVVTDVKSDGMLSGCNLQLLGSICAKTDARVIASGGVSRLDDIRRLRGLVPIGVEGAIIGTALYQGYFSLREALQIAGLGLGE